MFLNVGRTKTKTAEGDSVYQALIQSLDKTELLEEMVNFQEERTKVGQLTERMMIQGQILFARLEIVAESAELRELAKTYRNHLRYELEALQENKQAASN